MISLRPRSPRLTWFAVLAVTGAAALSIAACTSSHKSSTTSTSGSAATSASTSASSGTSATTEPPAEGRAKVSGLVASVAGNAIQVTLKDDSNATVVFTPATKITKITPAALTDVTTGSCVSVRPAKAEAEAGQPVTAASVRVKPAVDGKCPQGPKHAPASGSPAPSGSAAPAPAKPMRIRGTVASVANNIINVTTSDAAGNPVRTAVTVDDKTTYTKLEKVTPEAITAGKCIKARGTEDSAGKLQATRIKLRDAVDGKCDEPAKPGQGG